MKKKTLAAILALAMVLGLAACGNSGGSAASGAPAASSGDASASTSTGDSGALPTIPALDLLTGSATGSWYTLGAGISDKFNEGYEGFPMTATPGPGSIGNIGVISSGEAEIGMSYGPFLVAAVNGTAPYDQAYTNLRAIAALQPTVVQPLTTLDMNYFSDFVNNKLKGTIGMYPAGNASTYIIELIMQEYGLSSAADVESWGAKAYYADGASLTDGWADRHVDVYTPMLNVPASAVTECLVTRTDGHLFNLDDQVITALGDKYGFQPYTIPAGTYDGQDEDIQTVGLGIVIFTTEDADEELIYNFTKTLYENKEYFLGVHSSFAEFFPETMNEGTAIDLHPGAAKFYAEKGMM